MAYWLMKSEPEAFGWNDLVRDGKTEWDGVRNHAAANHLRAMAVGDEALFYHSGKGPEAVAVMRVSRAARPDGSDGNWVSVEVVPLAPLPAPVTLKAMKAEPALADLPILRQSRLSVAPVSDAEWKTIQEMAHRAKG
ncbi:EVE domain-containing protein [Sphingomonas japonica]|uniref:RNA-binding protein with PUA-like domain n=1 Tax=Sphingomonas japonica TaxID=511662 RepID=A0ABX0TW96_9SPHN|nr:EVE domain-containing protein [Sphingomonas japonica]NIJ22583.1 putative RNA-binding protein with PUA-like domain [Sphingomonas japonica]